MCLEHSLCIFTVRSPLKRCPPTRPPTSPSPYWGGGDTAQVTGQRAGFDLVRSGETESESDLDGVTDWCHSEASQSHGEPGGRGMGGGRPETPPFSDASPFSGAWAGRLGNKSTERNRKALELSVESETLVGRVAPLPEGTRGTPGPARGDGRPSGRA